MPTFKKEKNVQQIDKYDYQKKMTITKLKKEEVWNFWTETCDENGKTTTKIRVRAAYRVSHMRFP